MIRRRFFKNNLVVKSPIILPSEYEFHIKEGVNIDLQKEGYILVQGH